MPTRITRPWRAALAGVLATSAVLAGLLTVGPAAVVGADSALTTISSAGSASSVAVPVDPAPVDLVSVYERSALSASLRDRAVAAASAVGVPAAVVRGFQVGMNAVRRGGSPVFQAAAPGGGMWQVPMSVTAMDAWAVVAMMGRGLSGQVAAGNVIMSATSATMHHAQAGDVIDLVSGAGTIVSVFIGAVVADDVVGGSELTMSRDLAAALGATVDTSVLIFGHLDHAAVDNALAAQGILGDPNIRVRHTWDPQDPDSTLGLATTKLKLGEMSYRLVGADGIQVDPGWAAAFLRPREAYATGVRAQCNVTIHDDLAAALQDVQNAGLGGLIDVANTNTYGGCYGPRYNRLSINIGNLSRHTWGQPIDMNTTQNCQGCVPKMDCRIVQIFRSHNFAWGGNFIFSDGMHFEWTGRATNQLVYPSRYCANPSLPTTESIAPPMDRATFFDGATSEMVGAGD